MGVGHDVRVQKSAYIFDVSIINMWIAHSKFCAAIFDAEKCDGVCVILCVVDLANKLSQGSEDEWLDCVADHSHTHPLHTTSSLRTQLTGCDNNIFMKYAQCIHGAYVRVMFVRIWMGARRCNSMCGDRVFDVWGTGLINGTV